MQQTGCFPETFMASCLLPFRSLLRYEVEKEGSSEGAGGSLDARLAHGQLATWVEPLVSARPGPGTT